MTEFIPVLIIHKIVEDKYTTSELEEYFGKKWNILSEKLSNFLKNEPLGDESMEMIMHYLKENDQKHLNL